MNHAVVSRVEQGKSDHVRISSWSAVAGALMLVVSMQAMAADTANCLSQALRLSFVEHETTGTHIDQIAKKWACASSYSTFRQGFSAGLSASFQGMGITVGFSKTELEAWQNAHCTAEDRRKSSDMLIDSGRTSLTADGSAVFARCMAEPGPRCGLEEATDGSVKLRIAWFPSHAKQPLPEIKEIRWSNISCTDQYRRLLKGADFPDGEEATYACSRNDANRESSVYFLLDVGAKPTVSCRAELPKVPTCGLAGMACCPEKTTRCDPGTSCVEDQCLRPPQVEQFPQEPIRYGASSDKSNGNKVRHQFQCPSDHPVLQACKPWVGEGLNAKGEKVNPFLRGDGTHASGLQDSGQNSCVCEMEYEGRVLTITGYRYPWVSCGVTLECSDR